MVCNTRAFISRFSCSATTEWDSESVKSEDVFKQPINPEGELKMQPSTPQNQGGVRLHEFVSKTVRMPFDEKKSWLFWTSHSNFLVPAPTNFRRLNSCACSSVTAVQTKCPFLSTLHVRCSWHRGGMSLFRSSSPNPAFPVERGSSLARFHWNVVTAGWSHTPSVGTVALCRASPTWVARQSELGRCVGAFYSVTGFFSDMQAPVAVPTVHPISHVFPGCTCRLRPWHVTHDSSACGPLYQWDRAEGHAGGEWRFPAWTAC